MSALPPSQRIDAAPLDSAAREEIPSAAGVAHNHDTADTTERTVSLAELVRQPAFWRAVLRGVLVLGFLAVVGGVAYLWNREAGIGDLREDAQRRVSRLTQTLIAPTRQFGYLPALMATHPTLQHALAHPDDTEAAHVADKLLEQIHAESGVAVAYLLDTTGRVIAASNWREPGSFVDKNFGFRPYFLEAMRIGDGHFYGMGVVSLTPGYYLSRVVKEAGRNIGVAVVKVDIGNLDEDWRQEEGDTTVSDENGVIFLSSRPAWKYRPMRPLAAETLARLRRTRQYEAVLRAPLQIVTERTLDEDESLVRVLPVSGDGAHPAPGPSRGAGSVSLPHSSLPSSAPSSTPPSTSPFADARGAASGRSPATATWLLRSAELAGSPWTVSVFLPLDDVDAGARRAAVFSATVAGFLLLAAFSIVQMITRNAERENARRALSRAHGELEARHRDLQALTEELRLASITDPLTGAYNRRYFNDAAARMVSAARRHGQPLSVVLIDVDHFKRINDEYGHAAGDLALRELSDLCRAELREEDLFARLGGEEFVALLPGIVAENAAAVAERLRHAVEAKEIALGDKALTLTISSGVAQWQPRETRIEEAVGRADRAVYRAKREGRNRVALTE